MYRSKFINLINKFFQLKVHLKGFFNNIYTYAFEKSSLGW